LPCLSIVYLFPIFTDRNHRFFVLSFGLALVFLVPPLQSALTKQANALQAIPTFNIVGVVEDQRVTIETRNFPANLTFVVRMGRIGTRAVNGTKVGEFNSDKGGRFQKTFDIPDSLKGLAQIAIRADSTSGGYFAYNWFTNNTSGSAPTNTPGGPTRTPRPTSPPGYSGIPTFTILSVVRDDQVTIRTKNFPPNMKFVVRMGPMGTRGVNGTEVETIDSGSGGVFEDSYDIPAGLRGSRQISIRLESSSGYFAYNWFYNSTYP
jgi:hypothetical protein